MYVMADDARLLTNCLSHKVHTLFNYAYDTSQPQAMFCLREGILWCR